MKAKKLRQKIALLSFLIFSFISLPSYSYVGFFGPGMFLATSAVAATAITAAIKQSFATTDVTEAKLRINDIILANSEEKLLLITNDGNASGNVSDVSIVGVGSTIFGVTVGSISDCENISVYGGQCSVELTADDGAYGKGTIKVVYGDKEATSTISVTAPALEADNVVFLGSGEEYLLIKNKGNEKAKVEEVKLLGDGTTIFDVTVGDISSCEDIAAQTGTCSVKLTAIDKAHGSGTAEVKYNGGRKAKASVTVTGPTLKASDVTFAGAGEESVVLTNHGTKNASVSDLSIVGIGTSIFDVTVGSTSACNSIKPNESCRIPLTAVDSSYGDGTIEVIYDGKITTSLVEVLGPTLRSDGISFSGPGTQNLVLTNYGTENALVLNKPEITGDGTTIFDVTVGDYSSCQNVPPKTDTEPGTCNVSITAGPNAYKTENGSLKVEYNGKEIIKPIGLGNTSLKLYKCKERKAGSDYECKSEGDWVLESSDVKVENELSPQIYKYTVDEDKFSWQKKGTRYIDWKSGGDFQFPIGQPTEKTTLLEITSSQNSKSKCDNVSGAIAHGDSCIFSFIVTVRLTTLYKTPAD